jgi:hypothetical protein
MAFCKTTFLSFRSRRSIVPSPFAGLALSAFLTASLPAGVYASETAPLAFAEQTTQGSGTSDATRMTPQSFDKWVAREKEKGEQNILSPQKLSDALLARFRAGKENTDNAVLNTVDAWIGYEQSQPHRSESKSAKQMEKSAQVVQAIYPFVKSRYRLAAALLQNLAYIYKMNDARSLEVTTLEKADSLLIVKAQSISPGKPSAVYPLNFSLFVQRAILQLSLADAYRGSNNPLGARKVLEDVVKTIGPQLVAQENKGISEEDLEERRRAIDLYFEAGIDFINSFDDLDGLNTIVIPYNVRSGNLSLRQVLEDAKQRAIQDAYKDKQSFNSPDKKQILTMAQSTEVIRLLTLSQPGRFAVEVSPDYVAQNAKTDDHSLKKNLNVKEASNISSWVKEQNYKILDSNGVTVLQPDVFPGVSLAEQQHLHGLNDLLSFLSPADSPVKQSLLSGKYINVSALSPSEQDMFRRVTFSPVYDDIFSSSEWLQWNRNAQVAVRFVFDPYIEIQWSDKKTDRIFFRDHVAAREFRPSSTKGIYESNDVSSLGEQHVPEKILSTSALADNFCEPLNDDQTPLSATSLARLSGLLGASIANHVIQFDSSEAITVNELLKKIREQTKFSVNVDQSQKTRTIFFTAGKYSVEELLRVVSLTTGMAIRRVGESLFFVSHDKVLSHSILPILPEISQQKFSTLLDPISSQWKATAEIPKSISQLISKNTQSFAMLDEDQKIFIQQNITKRVKVIGNLNTARYRIGSSYLLMFQVLPNHKNGTKDQSENIKPFLLFRQISCDYQTELLSDILIPEPGLLPKTGLPMQAWFTPSTAAICKHSDLSTL